MSRGGHFSLMHGTHSGRGSQASRELRRADLGGQRTLQPGIAQYPADDPQPLWAEELRQGLRLIAGALV